MLHRLSALLDNIGMTVFAFSDWLTERAVRRNEERIAEILRRVRDEPELPEAPEEGQEPCES